MAKKKKPIHSVRLRAKPAAVLPMPAMATSMPSAVHIRGLGGTSSTFSSAAPPEDPKDAKIRQLEYEKRVLANKLDESRAQTDMLIKIADALRARME